MIESADNNIEIIKNITWDGIAKANETIRTTDIKGKEYAEVNQRIKAFRMVYPQGTIQTQMISNENGVCIFRASIYDGELLLATGTAYEKENSTFINKTSYIENCETSAIGRALGMAGFGIDTSVRSAEEVQNAMNNQDTISLEDANLMIVDFGKHKGESLKTILETEPSYMNWLMDSNQVNANIKKAVKLILDNKDKKNKQEMDNIKDHRKALIEYCKTNGKDMTDVAVMYKLNEKSTDEDFRLALEQMKGI